MDLRFSVSPRKRSRLFATTLALLLLYSFNSICAQAPAVTGVSPNTPVCQGSQVTITGNDFTDASAVQVGTLPVASFTVVNNTTITANIADLSLTGPVTVTTPNGTSGPGPTVSIQQAPIPVLTHVGAIDPFVNCSGSQSYLLNIRNNSSNTVSGTTYTINWGDNTAQFTQTDWPANAQTSHNYTSQGYFNITFTITPPNGCTKTVTYQFYNGVNPLASLTTTNPTTGLCAPASVEFQIGNWYNNSPGTVYEINFGDGSPIVSLPHPLNSTNTIFYISHTYNTTSCPTSPDFKATLNARNACFTTTYTLNQIIIRKKPQANFTVPNASYCVNTPVCFTNTSVSGFSGNNCSSNTTYQWDFGDNTPPSNQTSPCHTYATPGTYTVGLSATGAACGTDNKTMTVTILAVSPAPVAASPVTYCQGQTASPLTATGTGLLWYTSATAGPGSVIPPTPLTNVAQTFTYYVSQTLPNSCVSPRVPVTVVVNAVPAAPSASSPVNLCLNQTATALTATGNNLLWYTSATGGTGSSAAPVPATTAIGSTSYYVSQTANGCEGTRKAIVVNVNALATAPGVVSPVNYCQNQAAAQLTASGSGLLWYTDATGGSGSAVPPTPSTANVGSVMYYVSQTTGCGEGPRASITVNVSAGPSASISYPATTLCNAANTQANPNPPIAVGITGASGGTFSATPSGLLINSSTGEITPAGSVAGSYTVRYTIPASGGCSQFVATATISVNGSPAATITYPAALCTSGAIANVQFTGSTGGTFSSATGLSLNAITGAIDPTTSTPGSYTITYGIAAVAPCPGFTTSANVVINQAPSAAISYGQTNLCNVVNSSSNPNPAVPVNQTGTTGGVYSITPATGLPINSTTGEINPSGAAAGTYTIRYTIAASSGCAQYVASTTVNVSSAPSATISYAQAICSSTPVANVQLTGAQGGAFSSAPGLAIHAATGAITPTSSTPGTYTVTYTIAPAAPCPGFTTTFAVTITQAPSATISYSSSSLCNVQSSPGSPNDPLQVIQTGTQGGSYSVVPASGLSVSASTGTISPAGATPGTYTIRYTLPASGGCVEFVTTVTVVVSGAPTANISYPASPYCKGLTATQPVVLSGTNGGVYSSSSGLSINPSTGAINPSLSSAGIYTVTYAIAATAPCPGFIATTTVQIVPSPSVSFNVSDQSICSGGTAVYLPTSTVPNTTYAWTVSGSLPTNVTGLTSGMATGSNASISLSFINAGAVSQTITVQVLPTNPAANPCSGAPQTIVVRVNPIPAALVPADTTHLCMGAPATTLSVPAAQGHTVKWYDQNLNVLSAAPVIATTAPGQFVFFVSQSNVYGCEGPKVKTVVVVRPTPKIISATFTHPASCGIPSGSIVLNVLDINNNPMPNIPVVVHYTRFQVSLSMATSTDATGKITMPLTAGTYSGIYVEAYGCASQPIPDIFILKDPTPPAQPVAGYNPPICSGTMLSLTASSATSSQTGVVEYVWAGPAFGIAGDTVTNTVITFPSAASSYAGTYVVYAMQNNCISLPTSFQVVIRQSPLKPVITANTPLCIGNKLTFQASSSISTTDPTLNYVWTGPGAGFPVSSQNAVINSVNISDGGLYSVTVTSPQTGCSVTADTLIEVGGYPVVRFTPDTVTLPTGYLLNLNPLITNAGQPNILPIKKYDWTPSQDLICNDVICSSPQATIKNNVCYNVKVTNKYGCSGTSSICIKVFCRNSQVFIPNAFLPRGDVPENRKLVVRGSGINSVKSFRVFNRWGEVMFERNNFSPNDPNFGWDGMVKGKYADQGVYVYTVEVICENGVSYFYKGNVTLL